MFVKIVDDVRDWFVARGLDASVVDGIDSRNAQTNYGPGSANRVAFVAAADPIAILEPTHLGEDETGKRQLLNPQFVYEVSFAGYDAANPERDLAHRAVCFDLWEATVQAIQHAYFGAHVWTSAKWTDDRKVGRHGAELTATLTINVPLFDIEYQLAAPAPVPDLPKPAYPVTGIHGSVLVSPDRLSDPDGRFRADMVGRVVTISGGTGGMSGDVNGSFPIASFISANAIGIDDTAQPVGIDDSNGDLLWSVA